MRLRFHLLAILVFLVLNASLLSNAAALLRFTLTGDCVPLPSGACGG